MDSCTNYNEVWDFVGPWVETPGMQISDIVTRFRDNTNGQTGNMSGEISQSSEITNQGIGKRIKGFAESFVEDRRRNFAKGRVVEGYKRKIGLAARWWRLGVDTVVQF